MSLTRREFLTQAASAAVLAATPSTLARAGDARNGLSKPNVLFIICDDLGWGDVGVFYQNARRAAGATAERTPNLDRLAAAGARLTDHYCAAPVCAPSRASLMLGVHQGHANVRDNQFDKALEENHTLATILRGGGYATAAIGKWGLQGAPAGGPPNWPAHPLKRGFDYFFGYMRHADGHQHYPIGDPWAHSDRRFHNGADSARTGAKAGKTRARVGSADASGEFRIDKSDGNGPDKQVWENSTEVSAGLDKCYTADLFTSRAKRWMADHVAREPGRPFFLYLAFDTPHATIELPTQAYPAGGGLRGGLQWQGSPGHMINTASGQPDSFIYPAFANETYAGGKPWPDIYKRYATTVRRIDDCVGDLMELLGDLGVADNTLVVFTSDHGPTIESYLPEKITPEFFSCYGPFDGIKRDCWEGGIRVPAIACWPARIPPDRVIQSPTASWDWLPTLAESAGLPPPARTDGVSLLPVLTGLGSQRNRGYVYCEYFHGGITPDFPEFAPGRRGRARDQMQALRIGNLVGVRYDVTSADDNFEIYDVHADPKQSTNLGTDPNQVELQRRMKETVIRCRRPDPEAPRPYDDEPMAGVDPGEVAAGVEWCYFEGDFPWLPDLEALRPAASGSAACPDLSVRSREDRFGLLVTGYIEVPVDGNYTFYLSADTAAFLRIHDAAVIDADFGYAGGIERAGSVKLKAGLHPFRLSYSRGGRGSPQIAFAWQGPGFAKAPVPKATFRRASRKTPDLHG